MNNEIQMKISKMYSAKLQVLGLCGKSIVYSIIIAIHIFNFMNYCSWVHELEDGKASNCRQSQANSANRF